MKKVTVKIEKGKKHYSAYNSDNNEIFLITGQGDTKEDAKKDFLEAFEEVKEMCIEDNGCLHDDLKDIEFVFIDD